MVVPVNMVVETILVLLFYPLFVFSLKKLVVFPALKRLLDRAHQAAVQHQDKVRKYGIIGLLIFVWFPFWMTGPVVGCTIGYLLELPIWLNLSVVLIGTYIAMAAWGYVLFSIQSHAADLGSWAPVLIVGIIVAIVVVGYFLNRQREAIKTMTELTGVAFWHDTGKLVACHFGNCLTRHHHFGSTQMITLPVINTELTQ